MALIVLYALGHCDGSRENYRFKQPSRLATAADVLEFFELEFLEDEIIAMLDFLKYRRNRVKHWMRIAYPHPRHTRGVCEICQTPAKICQLPMDYANKYGWENDQNYPEEPDLCVIGYVRWIVSIGMWKFDYPTHWLVIDEAIEQQLYGEQ